jgi:hypothetical protein
VLNGILVGENRRLNFRIAPIFRAIPGPGLPRRIYGRLMHYALTGISCQGPPALETRTKRARAGPGGLSRVFTPRSVRGKYTQYRSDLVGCPECELCDWRAGAASW